VNTPIISQTTKPELLYAFARLVSISSKFLLWTLSMNGLITSTFVDYAVAYQQ